MPEPVRYVWVIDDDPHGFPLVRRYTFVEETAAGIRVRFAEGRGRIIFRRMTRSFWLVEENMVAEYRRLIAEHVLRCEARVNALHARLRPPFPEVQEVA